MKAQSIKLVVLTAIFVAVLDQLSKYLILSSFEKGEVLEIIPGLFNLTLHFNPGAAFGLMADLNPPLRYFLLSITTIGALALVIYFLIRDYLNDIVGQLGLALIIGGAIGNIIDRITLGEVVDFFDFYYSRYHWPAFNVADSCICVGVAILILRRPQPELQPKLESEAES